MRRSGKRSTPLTRWAFFILALLLALPLAGGLFSGCCLKWKNLTMAQKIEDFSYLFGLLEDNHPYLALKARVEGYDWSSHRQEFEQAVRLSVDDKSFAQAIDWMLKQINNGHTNISSGTGRGGVRDMANWNEKPWREAARRTSPGRADYWYRFSCHTSDAASQGRFPPFLAVYNGGQYVIVAVAPEEAVQKCVRPGMTVLQVGGLPIQDYVDGQRGLTPYRQLYDPKHKRLYQRKLNLPMEEQSPRVTLRDDAGQVAEVTVPYAKRAWDFAYPWPPKYTGKQGSTSQNLSSDILADGKVGYIQVASFMPLDQDRSALRRFFESIRDLPALIIDIRGNGGGRSTYWERDIVGQLASAPVECSFYLTWRSGEYVQPFAQAKMSSISFRKLSKSALVEKAGSELAANVPPEILTGSFVEPRAWRYVVTPRDSVNYQGKVFLLADDLCYSAADGFAAFCKGSGFATVVGTSTGGDGIALTPALITLPNSGMVVRFPWVLGLNPDFSASEEAHTFPDVMVEQNLEDILQYLATRDSLGATGPDPTCDAALRTCLALALRGSKVR